MISFEEYKERVYRIFKDNFLKDLSEEEKDKYLEENEDFIRTSYNSDLYQFEKMGMENIFSEDNILSRVCDNLSELY